MKHLAQLRPSPSMVVAFVALLVAMGGTGYAAIVLPANSVGSKQLKNKAVNGKKIATNAVSSGNVKNGSLLALDFKSGQLPGGPQGPQGPAGQQGPTGAPGSARAYGEVQINASGNFALVPGTTKNVVGLTQPGGSHACLQLASSIDAATAITVATANLYSGGQATWDTQVDVARPLDLCAGVPSNVVEILTLTPDAGAEKRAFMFAVM